MSRPTGRYAPYEPSPSATETLRPLSVVLDDLDGLTERLVRAVLDVEPAYFALPCETKEFLLRDCLRENIALWIRSMTGTLTPATDLVTTARETGTKHADHDVPLEATLRACRLGGRVVWEALLEASRERFDGAYDTALLEAAGDVWRLIDHSSAELADAYQLEQNRLTDDEVERRQVLNALIEGTGDDPELVREAAVVLGLPEHGPLVCVVAPVDPSGGEPLRAPQELLDGHGIVSCWVVRLGDTVGLVALEGRTRGEVLDLLKPTVAGRAGASPVVDGLAGVAVAYRTALAAARAQAKPRLTTVDERLPETLLLVNPDLASLVPALALGSLLDLPSREREALIGTLEAVLLSNGSAKRAAERLYCHRNTVLYRLHRIEEVTGRRLSRSRDRLLLALGLIALHTQAQAASDPVGATPAQRSAS